MAFEGFSQQAFDFLAELAFQNHKAFYEENRQRYETYVKAPMLDMARALAPTVEAIDTGLDTTPARALSRIRRDTRFSKDKSPYRSNAWLSFRPIGEKMEGTAGFWFEIDIGRISYGMGTFGMNTSLRDGMRRAIAYEPKTVLALLEDPRLARFSLQGDAYKRLAIPAGTPPILEALYRKKSFYFEHARSHDERTFSPALADEVAQGFLALSDLYAFVKKIGIETA